VIQRNREAGPESPAAEPQGAQRVAEISDIAGGPTGYFDGAVCRQLAMDAVELPRTECVLRGEELGYGACKSVSLGVFANSADVV